MEPFRRCLVRRRQGRSQLALLRFDAERAEIWLDASSLVARIKMLLGADPKQDYKDKSPKWDLGR